MLGLLQLDGYQRVGEPDGADFVVVNTCGFIEAARAESFAAIDEMIELKRAGKIRGVIVSGCLAERQKEQLLVDRPEIDHLVGVFGREEVTRVADRLVGALDEQRTVFRPAPVRALSDESRLRITPRHFAYLKVSEGCDRLCTFCAIPKMRGKHASKPIEQIVKEARQLVADGAREIILVAQDMTYYGLDLYGRPRLADLLKELDKVEGADWIRLMYFYPMYIDRDLIDVIAGADRIIPYIDMPLQHISDRMLKRMARRVDRASTERLIDQLRDGIDGLTLRTTFISGFPGETDEDFAELADFLERRAFDHVGVFTYSLEPDTPAAKLPDHVPADVAEARREELMAIQQGHVFDRLDGAVGQAMDVLIDMDVPGAKLPRGKKAWVARSVADAPDVDGLVFVTETDERLAPGRVVPVEIVARTGYDLAGVAVGPSR